MVLVLKDLEKDNYSIGETAKILGIEQHVVRFWSNTFCDYIKPLRKAGDRRYYRKKDIETLFKIKDMVYNQKYSLGGVKIVLQNTTHREAPVDLKKIPNTEENKEKINKLYSEVFSIKSSIEEFLTKK